MEGSPSLGTGFQSHGTDSDRYYLSNASGLSLLPMQPADPFAINGSDESYSFVSSQGRDRDLFVRQRTSRPREASIDLSLLPLKVNEGSLKGVRRARLVHRYLLIRGDFGRLPLGGGCDGFRLAENPGVIS